MQFARFTHDVLALQVVISEQQELARHAEQAVSLAGLQLPPPPPEPPPPTIPPLPPCW